MNLLIELRQLDINNAGNWPVAFKVSALIILFIAIIIAGYFLVWEEQIEALKNAQAQEETLRTTYLAKKKSAVNLSALRQRMKDVKQSLNTLFKQLPDKSEMEALLVDINQAGLGRGLQFELFKPAANEINNAFYAELPISVRVVGSYHDIGAFASDIAQLPRIVTLNNISITLGNDGKLVLDAIAKTFRYLDEEEVAKAGGRQTGGK
ncbi:type 4a pilus biogenesis protein PilO [Nitrosomonas sp. Nm166]|uniref:type 4a pilus biogenesis protein PilO n=1 Tax=Nitrosomonas sp. Nm166 TaxID=1881054 RepID=UPI0008E7D8C0|nr:type 4a pilus biogenesis protein PilO [Nitrosomonas sp. Nm166]SFE88356.1 type IV pilus assembly protein PilO [Nitrosomonas sp. Nm166]